MVRLAGVRRGEALHLDIPSLRDPERHEEAGGRPRAERRARRHVRDRPAGGGCDERRPVLLKLMADPNPRKAAAVSAQMMKMIKLDAGVLQAAYDAA